VLSVFQIVFWVTFIVQHVLSLVPNIPQPIYIFPIVALMYVNLKKELLSEDKDKRSMANQMIFKFEKYLSEFSAVLAIAVVLDPRYKLRFVKYYYSKIYGDETTQFDIVKAKLTKLYMEYKVVSTTSSSTVVQPQEDLDWEKVNNITSF
jgi:hypothetical protein